MSKLVLSARQRLELREILNARWTTHTMTRRVQIVLHAGEGYATAEIARFLGTSPATVRLWRRRYAAEGVDGLREHWAQPGSHTVVDQLHH